MKKSLENLSKEINDFFKSEPTSNQKAWGIINQFYHMILTHMEENNISKAKLAQKLNKSRSAISQMFNKTPNISVKKIVEIADAVGLEFSFVIKGQEYKNSVHNDAKIRTIIIPIYKEDWNELPSGCASMDKKVFLFGSQYGSISSDTSKYNNNIDVN